LSDSSKSDRSCEMDSSDVWNVIQL
jgi:hypothetical protein